MRGFIRSETAEAIDFVLYCERQANGKRRVRELIAVNGYDFATQAFETEDLYRAEDFHAAISSYPTTKHQPEVTQEEVPNATA